LDSEKIWDVALADLAAWLGGELSVAARRRMVGSSLARSIAIVHDDLDVEADPESSAAFLTRRTAELFRTDLVWKPGARHLIEQVRVAGLPTALVTSTHRRLTETALDFMGRELFDVTVTGDEIERPKPHPDPYLKAATALGVDPGRSVAIEDSELGARAAQAAGCVVLVVPSELPIAPAPGRTVIESLEAITVQNLRNLVDHAGLD
ncbi:MAG: HAD family phosphatase, partial [Actinobacteria bacterium]|nr:HAD family phosphatase [Actinomycetota bacterium]